MKKPPFIRSPYNYDLDEASNESAYVETMPSLTVQSQALDTDINEIVRRVGIGAPLPTNHRIPEFGDYTEIKDYRSAMDAIQRAQENFLAMPANVRATFENDPQLFLQFCSEPQNLKQMADWGLAIPRPIAPPAGSTSPTEGQTGEKDGTKK